MVVVVGGTVVVVVGGTGGGGGRGRRRGGGRRGRDAVSSPTARIDGRRLGVAPAPPLSSNGPSPKSTTSATVTPTATPKRSHGTPVPLGARSRGRARRVTTSSAPGPRCHGSRGGTVRRCRGDPVGRRPAVIGVRGVGGVGAPRHGAGQARLRHDRQRARAGPARPGRVRPRRSPGLRHRHRSPTASTAGAWRRSRWPRGARPRRPHRSTPPPTRRRRSRSSSS